MKRRVHVIPQTHWDAEVFISREETLAIGIANLAHELRLLAEQPGTTFVLDQACLLEPVLERHPELGEPIRRFVAEGRLAIVWRGLDHARPEHPLRRVVHPQRAARPAVLRVGPRRRRPPGLAHRRLRPPSTDVRSSSRAAGSTPTSSSASGSAAARRTSSGAGSTARGCARCGWPAATRCCGAARARCRSSAALAEKQLGFLEAQCSPGPLLALSGGDLNPPDPQLAAMVEQYNASPGPLRARVLHAAALPRGIGRGGPHPGGGRRRRRPSRARGRPQPGVHGLQQRAHPGEAAEPRAGDRPARRREARGRRLDGRGVDGGFGGARVRPRAVARRVGARALQPVPRHHLRQPRRLHLPRRPRAVRDRRGARRRAADRGPRRARRGASTPRAPGLPVIVFNTLGHAAARPGRGHGHLHRRIGLATSRSAPRRARSCLRTCFRPSGTATGR